MSAGRILLLIFGGLISLIGLGVTIAGAGVLYVNANERDDDGYFTTSPERFGTTAYALTSEEVELGADIDWGGDLGDLVRVRISAGRAGGGRPLFVGIGPEREVRDYLDGVAHDQVEHVEYDPFRVEYERRPGPRAPGRPGDEDFWAVQVEGAGRQSLEWDIEGGTWMLVVMSADASRGVDADVDLGIRIDHLVAIGIGLLIGGLVLLGSGVTMVVFGARGKKRPEPPAAAAGAGPPPERLPPYPTGTTAEGPPQERPLPYPTAATARAEPAGTPPPPRYPLRLEGELQPDLSRWLWLVKWLLAIPHYVVLVFLFVAFFVLSVIAFFAILFTGRYPRGIFDFNVGVLRWSWRVSFFSYSALGTDRYPPFTLSADDDYPATLEVDYPERLSRGLVLVKWWLLALPHLLIIGIFGSGVGPSWFTPWGDDWGWIWGFPLIGVLVIFAAVALLFTGRYPPGIFSLVMGLNRWTNRVLAYMALMRDEYPPFRLDAGGREPRGPAGGDGGAEVPEAR